MKKVILSFLVALILFSCNQIKNEPSTTTSNQKTLKDEVFQVSLKDFNTLADSLVGKKVVINGTVDHVCKHGGQKMMIVNRNTDARLKIVPGENMAAFNTELEGEDVAVTGSVEEERIDENYLREWEEELKAGDKKEKNEKMHTGMGNDENKGEEKDVSAELTQIKNLRKKLQDSGKDHLSFYSLICYQYKVLETEDASSDK